VSKTKEQSAIDAIYEILDKLELLDKRVQIIDDNVKILSNKITKLGRNAAVASSISVKNDSMQEVPARQQKVEKLILGNIKTYGYIVNKAKVPINDVAVNIYDNLSKLIKNIKTNRDGYWEVRLPSGKYGVEYIHKKFKPINKTIELTNDTNEYEVR
jgi:flagellar hook assembly protein FlgD